MKQKDNFQRLTFQAMLLLLFLLLGLSLVSALGIRPAQTSIIYENTPTYAGTFWVVNNDHQEMDLIISVEGELEKYVFLETKEITLSREDDFKPVYFRAELPDNLPPGETRIHILVEQKLRSTEEGFVSSKLVLRHKLLIQGPYPDKFVKTKLNFQEQSDHYALVSEVENLGKKDIGEVKTTFYLNDKEQKPLQLESESITLKPKENKLLQATLYKSQISYGEFEVMAVTTYDDQKVEVSKKMILGKPSVDITYFDRYFIANKINKYSLELLNRWNTPLENVFVDVEVKKDGEKIDEFRTTSVDLAAMMSKRINDYFDAKEKVPGKYAFEMVVNFWNTYKMDKKTFQSELITEEEFEEVTSGNAPATALSGQAASAEEEKSAEDKEKSGAGMIMLLITLGLLAGAAGFYVLWRYMHREEYDE